VSNLENNNDSLAKENSQMKEEIFRLSSLLANRELEMKNQAEKFKYKIATMKKESKTKDK
jgi:hypothetical protein